MIPAGIPTGAPNVLLTTRGRLSGTLRTVPLGMLELDGRWFVQASYGETGWVANLRADGAASVTWRGGRPLPARPPIGVLLALRMRIDETLDEYTAAARRCPLFELRPITRVAG